MYGLCYEYGKGVKKDIVKAVEYYIKSAERHFDKALKYTVSVILEINNQEQKEYYLNKAYELGCEGAAYELGNNEKLKDDERLSDKAIKFYAEGAESGDIRCAIKFLHNYSLVLGRGKNRNDRLEALKWFQFLFAHIDEEYLKYLRENNILATYYYAYAIELDYDPDVNLPDREFVQFYFEKSLNESPEFLNMIVNFVVDGYLYPEDTASGLNLDVVHAEEILNPLGKYLLGYRKYIVNCDNSNQTKWYELMIKFEQGYNKISDCYKLGKGIQKNKIASKNYKNKAVDIVKTMNKIALENPFPN